MRPETLIRLYPRAWRERYGAELLALLEATPMTSGVRADLLRGAAREWRHELFHPRKWTPGRRMAASFVVRGLMGAAFSGAIVVFSMTVAPALDGVPLPWPVLAGAGLLFLSLVGRAIHAQIRAGLLSTAAHANPRVLRSTVSYREFALWIASALVVATIFAIDSERTWLSAASQILTWLYWFHWMHAATPRQIRRTRIERRLMQRPGHVAAAIDRFERKRAENAERLMRFYGRVPPLPSPFVASRSEASPQ
jgi:hypothetical protein